MIYHGKAIYGGRTLRPPVPYTRVKTMRLPTIKRYGEHFTTRQSGNIVDHYEIALKEYIKVRQEPEYWSRLRHEYKAQHPAEEVESCNVVRIGNRYFFEVWRHE